MQLLVTLVTLTVCASYLAEDIPSPVRLLEFTSYIERLMQCRNIPAVSVTLVKGDKFVWTRGFGFEDIENGIRATNKTRFCIGSLSKAFTTTLLGKQLTERKDITWDTPVRQILGNEFRLSDDWRTNIASLRDLLAHKMGVPGYFNAFLNGFPTTVTRTELVRRLQFMTPTESFRSSFLYNNYMYSLAGSVAEVLGNASWEKLVRDKILTPLNMRSSGFIGENHSFENFALPYVTLEGKLLNVSREVLTSVDPAGPAGSIFTTADDMVQWIRFHLNATTALGKSDRTERMAEMYRDQMSVTGFPSDKTKPKYPVNDVNIAYALGWVNSNYRGYRKIWHSGGIISFTSNLWLFPDVKAGLFFSISGPLDKNKRRFTEELSYHAADLLLNERPWLNMSTACIYPLPFEQPDPEQSTNSPKAKKQASEAVPNRPLDVYTGVYGHLAFGNITVSLGVSAPGLRLKYGRFGEMKLDFVKEPDTFVGTYLGSLWFVTGSDDGSPPWTIRFRSKEGDKMVSYLEYPVSSEIPSTFVRDLRFDEPEYKNKEHCVSAGTNHICGLPVYVFTITALCVQTIR